ncbi:Uncharacterized protein FVE85_7249 [Porphyridium purpureum]|uniref:Protein kinase domain-containing protein n=1 Tax=Porphyridium purpureum TaxID=35688 RepID=A0A5J4Z9J0_PORPP|nr:Uncharacterized protein FVE85_7249 [Porphyridium purpureum]|eukprot:POR7470..scf295_1
MLGAWYALREWGREGAARVDVRGIGCCVVRRGEMMSARRKERLRAVDFWQNVVRLYGAFKVTQLRVALVASPRRKAELWNGYDTYCAAQIYALCVRLRGFYLKVGQFLGTRADFLKPVYIASLSRLQDRVPPMPIEQVLGLLKDEMRELGYSVEEVFESVEADPLGSATIAQVHAAVIRKSFAKRHLHIAPSRRSVVIKLQYPEAEKLMHDDLANVRSLGAFLQRTELQFDVLSPIDELREQVRHEFDFHREARNLNVARTCLEPFQNKITVPDPLHHLVSRRCLVMERMHGVPLTELEKELQKRRISHHTRQRLGMSILSNMATAYGKMLFETNIMQADPHPGNVLLHKSGKSISLLDFGQVKSFEPSLVDAFAELILSMRSSSTCSGADCGSGGDSKAEASALDHTVDLKRKMAALGIQTARIQGVSRSQVSSRLPNSARADMGERTVFPQRRQSPEHVLLTTMFDTVEMAGVSNSPFEETSIMREISVESFPQNLFFVLRTTQIFRGMSLGMGLGDKFSLLQSWEPFARKRLLRTGRK